MIIVIFSMIAIFFINLIFIDKILSMVSIGYRNKENFYNLMTKKELTDALIYGEGVFSLEISDILIQHNISSKIFNDLEQIDKSQSYRFLIAVNKSDLENIITCSTCKKMMEIGRVLAICNNYFNKKIYEENHILYVYGNSFSASDIVNILLNIQEGGDINVYDKKY